MQVMGELCLSWYALADGDRGYRPLEVGLTLGPDLARPLRPVWHAIEKYAEQIERLSLQQAGLAFEIVGDESPSLAVSLKLAAPEQGLWVLLNGDGVRYYLIRDTGLTEVVPKDERVDRGVYLILAELAS
jgi:hypothetical protein